MPKSQPFARRAGSGVRAVIDTNILVSAAINSKGSPGRVVEAIKRLILTPAVSVDILAEYEEVLRRPRFGFPAVLVGELLANFDELGVLVEPAVLSDITLPDPDDAPFIAAALAAVCPIVTGNTRHFPKGIGIEVLSPTECLARLPTG